MSTGALLYQPSPVLRISPYSLPVEMAVLLPGMASRRYKHLAFSPTPFSFHRLSLEWFSYDANQRKYLLKLIDILPHVEEVIAMYRTGLLPTGLVNKANPFMRDAAGE